MQGELPHALLNLFDQAPGGGGLAGGDIGITILQVQQRAAQPSMRIHRPGLRASPPRYTRSAIQWATLTAGTLLAGYSAAQLGYRWAFIINSLSFVFSAGAIWRIATPGGFRPSRSAVDGVVRPWREYREGLAYLRSVPLMMGIAMISVGWALGGGAAQILFALFGEQVFHRGPSGIGGIWGFAGIGLLAGGALAHFAGRRASFARYKRAVTVSYIVHGAAYMIFSQASSYGIALAAMMFSRIGMAVTTVLNNFQLLRHTPDQYRGRVFATMESLRWSMMIVSMAAAGIASQYYSPRTIGLIAGALGLLTALAWAWCDWTGRLPEPHEETSTSVAALRDVRDSTL